MSAITYAEFTGVEDISTSRPTSSASASLLAGPISNIYSVYFLYRLYFIACLSMLQYGLLLILLYFIRSGGFARLLSGGL